MNLCFIIGKIVSDIKFDFFYNSKKHNSMAKLEIISLYHDNLVYVCAYDDNADIVYRKYKKGKIICFIGKVRNTHVEITHVIN